MVFSLYIPPRIELTPSLRDSEESAPAEYPPEQPDVDAQEDDEAAYAADEVEADAAEGEAEGDEKAGDEEDFAMADADEKAVVAAVGNAGDEDAASDVGSEDLEAESSGEEDEDAEEEDEEGEGEAEGEGDEMMDVTDENHSKANEAGVMEHDAGAEQQQHPQHQHQDVMVH